jgi:hypothetical protein
MVQCPYPETFIDQASDKTEFNILYLVWHEGFEAHKFEMANLSIQVASLAVALDNEIRNVSELRMKMEKEGSNLQEANLLGDVSNR